MLHRLGALLAATTITLAGWAGAAQAQVVTPSPAPTPTVACPPVLPLTGSVAGTTQTSVTVRYSMMLVGPPCGYVLPVTVTLFASLADAQQWRDPVAAAVSGPERYGDVTLDGLVPDTEYWFRFSDGEGRRDVYTVGGPARTLPVAGCVASAVVDAAWAGGFVGTVTVRNIGNEPIDGWRVSWQWPGDERIQAVWGGEAASDGASVVVRNVDYNGTVAPDGTATFGLLVATSRSGVVVTPACSA